MSMKATQIMWRDHVTSDEVCQRSRQRKLSEIVKEHLKMLGHIIRMPEERLAKTSLEWTPTGGKREKGQTSYHLEKSNTRPARHGDPVGRVQDYSCQQSQMESCCCPVFQPELEELSLSKSGRPYPLPLFIEQVQTTKYVEG